MVIQQRTDLRRNRILYFLSLVLAAAILTGIVLQWEHVTQPMQIVLFILGLAAIGTIALALVQLYSYPKRSHAILIQRERDIVIATNAVHEGFKLRFLRDVIGESVFSFSDEDREQLKPLEADGYYAAFVVRNVRKLLVLRLCTMMFDDVFCVDPSERWEHHDSSSTSEPSFHKREMPRLRTWKADSTASRRAG
jgi:hypothetical protein